MNAIDIEVAAGAKAYRRKRDLPFLLHLWPTELADFSDAGRANIVAKLAEACMAQRRMAKAGHWAYEFNRHVALLAAYHAEAKR